MPPVIKKKNKKENKVKEAEPTKDAVVSGQLQKKISNAKPAKEQRGVVFIKHLPHGFFEQQMKSYFEQFGKVTRLRLARSRKTGGSKGYAFVEFEYPEVAQVAAETMDNYLMFKKIVKAAYIPPEKQLYNYFKSTVHKIKNKSGKTVWVSSKTAAQQRKMKKHNDWTDEAYQKRTAKQLKKLKKLGDKFAHLGVDVDEIIMGAIGTQTADDDTNTAAGSSKSKKRKAETSKPEEKKSKKQPKLEDLLGNTLQEDSEDEDYIAVEEANEGSNDDDESSDEESYGFLKDSGDEEDDDDDENQGNSDDEDEEEQQSPPKKTKSKFSKSLKSSNIERFDQMLKRKPHQGGIQKQSKKKSANKATSVKAKNKMQLLAAKELAKPLVAVKAKGGKKVKQPLKKAKKVK